MEKLQIYTDGGARGNPGPAAIGVVIKHKTLNMEPGVNEGKIIAQFGKRIGETTNNVAEYVAVIEALQWLRNNLTIEQLNNLIIVFSLDSKLVVNQLNGLFKIKNANLRQLILKIRQLETEVGGRVSYQLIPREENFLADDLLNRALES